MAALPSTSSPIRSRLLRPVRFGLRTRLVSLVLLAIIPMIVLKIVEIRSLFDQRIDRELDASLELAQATSAAFTNYLNDLWNTELAIGLAMALKSMSADDAERFMREQLVGHPTVRYFSWIGPGGVVVATTEKGRRGVSFSDREYVQRIIRGEDRVVSDLLKARLVEGLSVVVARAIRRSGELVGIVTASLNPDRLGVVLPVERKGRRALVLADRQGILVYHSSAPSPPFEERRFEDDAPIRTALRDSVVVTRKFPASLHGGAYMGAGVSIPPIGWATFAAALRADVLAQARTDGIRSFAVLLMIAGGSLVAALLAARSFVRRIDALERAAQAISSGDLTARTGLRGTDELGVAGEAFDRMACRVQDIQAERLRFVHVAAHELRNPLAVVKSVCSLLRLQIGRGKPTGDLGRKMAVVEREADRLVSLLNEVVDAFQGQEGFLVLKQERVDLKDVIRSALEPFLESGGSHPLIFEGEMDGDMNGRALVSGDPRRLGDVARNLVGNATKYSPDGGEVRVGLRVQNARAIVSVRDHGLGIPHDQLERVFESFYRADNLGKLGSRDPGGMGLGLPICRSIVERHGGRIWAESKEGEGSTFYVELPLLSEVTLHS